MDRNIELIHKSEIGTIPRIKTPRLGLGVYQIPSNEIGVESIRYALEIGYRHIDTASIYQNELEVGQAIRASGINREKIFVTTKLWPLDEQHDYVRACRESLQRMGLDYIDLYLIHAPPEPKYRKNAWRAMEHLLEIGNTRAIGVSNYGVKHLEELFDYSNVHPSVNQIEISPYLQRQDLVEFCSKNDIVLMAYSPLTRGLKLEDKKLRSMASKYRKTPAQLLIRWSLQSGYIVIPKSSRYNRIKENFSIFDFEIEKEDMVDMLKWDEKFITGWDPTNEP
jgi:diketogulonate reductase-like aldo/keto reductase